jgi:hypothetical protein
LDERHQPFGRNLIQEHHKENAPHSHIARLSEVDPTFPFEDYEDVFDTH